MTKKYAMTIATVLGCSSLPEKTAIPSSVRREIVPLVELEDQNPDPNIFEGSLVAEYKKHILETDEDTYEIEGYAYNNLYPGPLIKVAKGMELHVEMENR